MTKSYFFVGIGGSGMLPLAQIVRAGGATVAGSDRAIDQGRGGAKFDALRQGGVALFAQDGSGIVSAEQIVVASAAIEDSVPDIARARELGCARMTRAELLAELFNAAPVRIAVGGTSGKSTVTGMIGWILTEAGMDPTIMNGAVMKNFSASARVGSGPFVSEVDESDGSITLYRPTVAVLNNVAFDHKPLAELRTLFSDFLSASSAAVVNLDDPNTGPLLLDVKPTTRIECGFGFNARNADFVGSEAAEHYDGINFVVAEEAFGPRTSVKLRVPGRHNASNALMAIGAVSALGISVETAATALAGFAGLARRMDTVGTANGITVIDDFGHNPDKITATLSTLHAFPGRLLVFFQPHGYGPLKQMARELADAFRENLRDDDRLIVSDPAYFGGTVDRSVGSDALVALVGGQAEHIALREGCGDRLVELAQPGDRIIVMGARDDSLSVFARAVLERL